MHIYNYKLTPEHDIRHGSTLILYGLSHKETGRPALRDAIDLMVKNVRVEE